MTGMSPEGIWLVTGVPLMLAAVKLILPKFGRRVISKEKLDLKPLLPDHKPLPSLEEDRDSSILRMREEIRKGAENKVTPIRKKVA